MSDDIFDRLKTLDAGHKLLRSVPALTWFFRLVSGAVYRLLELLFGRRHPHVRVEQQARKLVVGEGHGALAEPAVVRPVGTPRDRVLFFTKRGWFAHVTTEGVLAKALQQRGADPHFFLCGGVLSQCDFKPPSDPHVTSPLCRRCTGFGHRFLQSLGLPVTFMDEFLDADERSRLGGGLGRLSRVELLDYEHEGDPLGQWALPSVQRSLLRGDVGEDPWSERVLHGYVQSARIIHELAGRLLGTVKPATVVLTNGSFFAERIILEAAVRRGIDVVAYERGQLANTIVLDRDRPAVPFKTDDIFARFVEQALSDWEEERLDAYLQQRAHGDVGLQGLWPTMERDGRAIFDRLELDPERPVVTAYTNVMWDTAVFRRDRAFDGLVDWVFATIDAAAQLPDQQFVIRVHPAEVRLPMLESRDRIVDRLREHIVALPDNVVVVPPDDPASSYALMAASQAVLVYTSTVGLEAAVRGIPVVVGGLTHYRAKGFTRDVADRAIYARLIADAVASGQLDPERRQLARRYAYTFFFRYQRPFPWVDDSSRANRSLEIADLDALAPGRSPEMDNLCRWILEGGELPEPIYDAIATR